MNDNLLESNPLKLRFLTCALAVHRPLLDSWSGDRGMDSLEEGSGAAHSRLRGSLAPTGAVRAGLPTAGAGDPPASAWDPTSLGAILEGVS